MHYVRPLPPKLYEGLIGELRDVQFPGASGWRQQDTERRNKRNKDPIHIVHDSP